MFVLAALCLIAGILPGVFIDALAPVVKTLVGDRMPMQIGIDWLSIVPIAESRSSYNGLLVFLFISASASLAAVAIHRLASDVVRKAPPWDCGFGALDPRMQDTAEGFGQPVRHLFQPFFLITRHLPDPFDTAPRYHVVVADRAWATIYDPMARLVQWLASQVIRLQQGRIASYLLYSFVTLLVLLALVL